MQCKHGLSLTRHGGQRTVPNMLGNGVSPGEKVRAARERAGLSQEELGERTGLGQHGISRIETGRSKITLDKALKIARALGMATGEILEEGTSVPRKGVSTITKALAPRLKTPAMPAGNGRRGGLTT